MSDIEARKLSIERDANRRKVMWEEAIKLAKSGQYPDALAIESELMSMGLAEAKHAFSEQDIKQIQLFCDKARSGAAADVAEAPAAAAATPQSGTQDTHIDAAPRPSEPKPALRTIDTAEPAKAAANDAPAAPSVARPSLVAVPSTPAPLPEPPKPVAVEPEPTRPTVSATPPEMPADKAPTRPAGIGRLARVSAAEAWGDGELDLAAWIAENPDIAMEVFGFTLAGPARHATEDGTEFSTVVDSNGRTVLIESRFDRPANDQLGIMIAQLAASEAHVALWLVSEASADHERAVAWLNQTSTCLFYLVKLEAVRIGNSEPAPILTLLSGPSPKRTAN